MNASSICAPRLRDRVQVAERELLARERHVDDVLRQRALELGALELRSRAATACSIAHARRVQRHAGLAVADLAERQLEVALAAEVADAQLLELVRGRGGPDRAQGFALERLRVHARDCIGLSDTAPALSEGFAR